MVNIIDVTLTFSPSLPCWPGDPAPQMERIQDMSRGDECNVTKINSHVHAGTHVDAPVHFLNSGDGVDQLSLDILIGNVTVVEILDKNAIDVDDLERMCLPVDTKRLLFKTRNSDLWNDPTHDFVEDFVALTPAAAEWVVSRGIALVGIDYLSIERYREPDNATHHALLGNGVVVVEGLDLRKASPGLYRMICLPMKISGSDGAPARVVLESLHQGESK